LHVLGKKSAFASTITAKQLFFLAQGRSPVLKTILVIIVLLVLLAGGVLVWINYGQQLAQLPAQISGMLVDALKGMAAGLGGLGSAVADSFKSLVP
jgi:cytochrome b subunit of formate dehydrogenase